ncbi:1-phosphofructokinase [Chromobacterium alkanivorans]|uniref:1-phosphofructokinase n=1 Tax=Chromobacterium alkanivorans TaxID=1071719 RepID=UPI0021673388|nr:1-phosphofructokinase [Chromobacterium alkanivorans]MCS3804477.1 1-phosphofructokinase [Chromobacterium alkanivorans]MCS3818816.1 1-phosphofructokinase [Chromobacterium alkanivorans]MCS3873326.1 1-phosphofructokinase [Chromobacterium alkanivorans]
MSARVHTVTLNPALDQTIALARLTPGAVNLAQSASSNAGGKGVNVASCLADWGAPVGVCGLLGRNNSEAFEQLFLDKRIADHMLRLPGDTRVNIKLADLSSGDTTDVNLPGIAAGEAQLEQVGAELAARLRPGDIVALCGSLPPGLPADSYLRLCRLLRPLGARLLLDSSGEALSQALDGDAPPHCVKPNRHELELWAGRALPDTAAVLACARGLLQRGVEQVVVSLGADGALFASRDRALLASLPAQQPLSTVGAGDALVAGLAAARLDGLDLEAEARLAVAFAAAKLARVGPHLPPPEQVRAMAAQVRLQSLD